ncbi:MAG: hypothetical protein ACEQSU_09450 [Microgenomates group bacterium]
MTAEGWNGKSNRQHMEHVESKAGRAVEIAEDVEARLDELRCDPGALSKYNARQEIERWQALSEVRGVREAIAEWRRLDAKLLPPVPKGAQSE